MSNVCEIEKELQTFRQKQQQTKNGSSLFSSFWSLRQRQPSQESQESLVSTKQESANQEENIASDDEHKEVEENQSWTSFDITVFCMKVIIYITMQIIAVMVEFGAVFFSIALLFFICTNLRSHRKRRSGELSAYSVFNPGCESIQGTISAEKLQSELTFGALHF
ncbi:uncharacterized protein B4U80_01246 [Leptotrombidium deliense]|uniref:SAYSvFN domain-containing protein n=1 Tax=Leptotrombidium deliense TaxID=299467 RepID=A0A443SFD9_9ACAR|nr:uncharacterized protein B4U80_01246 [Leptotrombidium deliense]